MKLSIVSTLYGSAGYLPAFHARATAAARELTEDYEMILVNDGSPDHSLEVALTLRAVDPRIRVVDLSRNFGHHRAMMSGLGYARGDLVFLVDCDLEEEPELLIEFARQLRETGADAVYGVMAQRKGRWFERNSGRLFYFLFRLLSSYPVPPNQLVARLMTRRYVDALLAHREREVFIAGLWAITGFQQVAVRVGKHSKGASSYSLRCKLDVLVNSLTSFSDRPLVLIFYSGCSILVGSTLLAAYLILRKLIWGELLIGWASLMVVISFFGGLAIFCIGIVGLYLSKVFIEVKERPYTIVRQVYE